MFILYILIIYVVCLASILLLYGISFKVAYKNALEEKYTQEYQKFLHKEAINNEDRN